MSAYFVIDLSVTDPDKLAEYTEKVDSLVAKFGGRFLVRGGDYEVIEGNWTPQVLVVAEYPNVQAIKDFHDSPEYAPLMELRLSGSTANALAVEGYDES